jgi:hypothetical protein
MRVAARAPILMRRDPAAARWRTWAGCAPGYALKVMGRLRARAPAQFGFSVLALLHHDVAGDSSSNSPPVLDGICMGSPSVPIHLLTAGNFCIHRHGWMHSRIKWKPGGVSAS